MQDKILISVSVWLYLIKHPYTSIYKVNDRACLKCYFQWADLGLCSDCCILELEVSGTTMCPPGGLPCITPFSLAERTSKTNSICYFTLNQFSTSSKQKQEVISSFSSKCTKTQKSAETFKKTGKLPLISIC